MIFALPAMSVQLLYISLAAVGVILTSQAAMDNPCFSNFILSRTGTWSVRDKIKFEKKRRVAVEGTKLDSD